MSQFLTIENGNHKLKDAPTGGGAAPYSEILVNFNLNEIQDSAFEKMSLYQFPTDTNNKLKDICYFALTSSAFHIGICTEQ